MRWSATVSTRLLLFSVCPLCRYDRSLRVLFFPYVFRVPFSFQRFLLYAVRADFPEGRTLRVCLSRGVDRGSFRPGPSGWVPRRSCLISLLLLLCHRPILSRVLLSFSSVGRPSFLPLPNRSGRWGRPPANPLSAIALRVLVRLCPSSTWRDRFLFLGCFRAVLLLGRGLCK